MTNKRSAMELSMTTIITLVITIIVFTMLLSFGFRMLGFGEQKTSELLDKYELEKFEATCDNEKVCIETTEKTSELAVFHMKIMNVEDVPPNEFTISVSPIDTGFDTSLIQYDTDTITIPDKGNAHKVILVDASQLDKDTYQFKVNITKGADNYFSKFIYLYVE